MRVKVRTTKAMYEQGIGSVCQGGIFETSLKRAEELRKAGVVKIIQRIPEPDRLPEIIKLREQGLTYQAIGEKLGISKVAVYKQLKRKGLAGIPGVGKTTILNQLCDVLAKDEIPTVYFLTEEPAYRLIQRTYIKEGLECMRELKNNQPKILEYRRVFEMLPEYTAENLKDILQGIKNKLEAEGKHYPVFILDSLQALRLGKGMERMDIRVRTIFKTEYLSHIARDLEIPVIFTSFVAREHYSKNFSKPTVAIFKEAGDIEYLIDVGMDLWVENEEELKTDEPEVKLYFVKNRFGRYGEVNLRLIKKECRFAEI